MKTLYSLFTFLFLVIASEAQPEGDWMQSPYLKINGSQDEWKRTNFYEIQKAFYAYEKDWEATHPHVDLRVDNGNWEDEENQVPGRLQYQRWENLMAPRVFPSGDITLPATTWENFQKYLDEQKALQNRTEDISAANWTSLGPSTDINNPYSPLLGRVNFVKFHPTNTNTMWVGTSSGGLWKSTNGGSSWAPLTDKLNSMGCSDLAVDPTNTNIMYLATGDGDAYSRSAGFWKTIDGGVTWSATGLSWTVSQFSQFAYKVKMHPTNSNILLSGTSQGLYKTTNAGTIWSQKLSGGQFKDVAFKPGDPSIVYAAKPGTFYRSTDTANTFTAIAGLPTGTSRYLIATTAANPSYVYLFHGSKVLYRSTDSGLTFTLQSSTPEPVSSSYAMAITVNPLNANDVYIGGLNTYRSIDGGITWTGLPTNPNNHVDVHGIAFLPGSSTTLFDCTDGGITKSTNNGTSWSTISNGIVANEVYGMANSATIPSLIIAGSQDNGTSRMNSSGWGWKCAGDGTDGLIDYINPDIIYFSNYYGQFFKTTTGTTTFTFGGPWVNNGGSGVNSNGYWTTPIKMHPTDHNTILIGKNSVYRTTDAGGSWSALPGISIAPNPFNIFLNVLAYAPSNPNYMYAYYPHPSFYVSTDGNTFVDRTSTFADTTSNFATGIAVSYTDPQKIWVCFSGYNNSKVYYSSNAGLTWTNYSTGLPSIPCNSIIYQNGSSDGLYLAMDIGIYYRNSTMSSWQLYNTGLPNARVFDLEIQYSSGKIRAATFGRGIWESNLYIVGISETSALPANVSVYPNPAVDNVTITVNNISGHHKNELAIYNVIGEVVYSETLTSNVKKLDVELFSSGVYFVKVSDGEKTYTQKLVIQ
jgi:photosystem II stability/assembly factor-like uncharacterized protein